MPVLCDRQGHVATLTLSRPAERNAWGPDFMEGLAEHLNAIEDDDEIRCVVLTGDPSGHAFCAGAYLKDPKTHSLSSAADFLRSVPKRRSFDVAMNSVIPGWVDRLGGASYPIIADTFNNKLGPIVGLRINPDGRVVKTN